MRVELREAVQRIEKSPARALLIRGEGDDFCLGGEILDWPGIPTEILRPKIQVFAEALDHLERLPIPTIAAVQRGCMGGGFELRCHAYSWFVAKPQLQASTMERVAGDVRQLPIGGRGGRNRCLRCATVRKHQYPPLRCTTSGSAPVFLHRSVRHSGTPPRGFPCPKACRSKNSR